MQYTVYIYTCIHTPIECEHYENMPMQYTVKIFGCKNENFQWEKFDIFLIFAQNIDCGYTLEPPRRYTPAYPGFAIYKWGSRGIDYMDMLS